MDMEKLYSIKDAALALGGISPNTVRVWLVNGKLERTKVGRRTMISESSLRRVIEPSGIHRRAQESKELSSVQPEAKVA